MKTTQIINKLIAVDQSFAVNADNLAEALNQTKSVHVGIHANRLSPKADNPREVAFANQWKEENGEGNISRTPILCHLIGGFSKRDAQVAATIIQWLGSNIGMSFIGEVIRKERKVKDYLENFF